MDEILYLEPDEEITSVIDKIKNLPGNKVGLVVPREATLLQSVVNLRLLAKEAAALGKEISIVTADKIGRNLAAQIGLNVYSSVSEEKPVFTPPPPIHSSQEVIDLDVVSEQVSEAPVPPGVSVHHFQNEGHIKWRSRQKPVLQPTETKSIPPVVQPRKEKKEIDPRLKKFIWPFLGFLVILSGVAAYLLVPKAYVTISVPSKDLNKNLKVVVSNKITEADIEQAAFPGILLESMQEKSEKFTATGKKDIGEKARGTITVYNSWESTPRVFPAGTKFSSSSKIFISTNTFTIPGTAIREGTLVPGTVSVKIEAENPGEEFNIKAGRFSILGLPSAQQEKIYGNSTSDMTGGLTRQVQVVSKEDYENAKKKLADDLSDKATKDLKTKATNAKLLDTAVVSSDPEVTSSAKVDDEAKDFEMKVKVKKQAMVFNFNQYKEYIVKTMETQVTTDQMIVVPNDNDLGLSVEKTAFDKGEMNLNNDVTAKIAARISADKIKSAISGKKIQEAERYIKDQPGVSAVKISFNPAWWIKKIPDLSRNVNVEVIYISE